MKTDNVIEKASLGKKLKGRHFGKWIGIAVLAAMFCVAGLVMSGEAQADRFVNNNDGTITDTKTGLMWADHDNGSDINWLNAKSYCAGYSGGGKSGWRMPTIDELRSLYDNLAYGRVLRRTNYSYPGVWSSMVEADMLAAYFDFAVGNWYWRFPDKSGPRALPVRSGN